MTTFRKTIELRNRVKKSLKSIEPSETELQSSILRLLEYSRLVHWRQNLGGIPARIGRDGKPIFRKNPMKGFPDIGGIIKVGELGVLWVMEIKTRKGVLSADQKDWLKILSENGVICRVVRSFQEAEQFICELKDLQVKSQRNLEHT